MQALLVIILLGAPGSGKGTQAERISKEMHVPHISTGDLFRKEIKEETPLGRKVQSLISQGLLVPDEIVLKMLFQRLEEKDCEKGYLLDGFPRTIPQAEELQKHIPSKARTIVLDITVSDATIIQRLQGRQKIEQRSDDAEEAIKKRIQVYKEETQPLTEYYKEKNLLHTINGEQDVDAVYTDIVHVLQK